MLLPAVARPDRQPSWLKNWVLLPRWETQEFYTWLFQVFAEQTSRWKISCLLSVSVHSLLHIVWISQKVLVVYKACEIRIIYLKQSWSYSWFSWRMVLHFRSIVCACFWFTISFVLLSSACQSVLESKCRSPGFPDSLGFCHHKASGDMLILEGPGLPSPLAPLWGLIASIRAHSSLISKILSPPI